MKLVKMDLFKNNRDMDCSFLILNIKIKNIEKSLSRDQSLRPHWILPILPCSGETLAITSPHIIVLLLLTFYFFIWIKVFLKIFISILWRKLHFPIGVCDYVMSEINWKFLIWWENLSSLTFPAIRRTTNQPTILKKYYYSAQLLMPKVQIISANLN